MSGHFLEISSRHFLGIIRRFPVILVYKELPIGGIFLWKSVYILNPKSVFSVENSEKLISIGYNPKFELYGYNEETAKRWNKNWQEKLGNTYGELNSSFWFSVNNLQCREDCKSDCNDKIEQFHYGKGHRVDKSEQIGQGGFSKVFAGSLHGKIVAAKFIEVTSTYRKMVANIRQKS